MRESIALCAQNFRDYWGGRLLNALKALHAVRFSGDEDMQPIEEEEEEQA